MKTITKYLVAGIAGLASGCGSTPDPITLEVIQDPSATIQNNFTPDTGNNYSVADNSSAFNDMGLHMETDDLEASGADANKDTLPFIEECDKPTQYLPQNLPTGLTQGGLLCEYSTQEIPVDHCVSKYTDGTDEVTVAVLKTSQDYFSTMVSNLKEDLVNENFQGFYLSDNEQIFVLVAQQGLLQQSYLAPMISEINKQCQPLEVVEIVECELSKFYQDADGDLEGNIDDSKLVCDRTPGYVTDNSDCDDTNQSINTNSEEIKDGLDNNCDGQIDEGLNELPQELEELMDDDAVLGNPKAPVSIVGFIDYEDPFNKIFVDDILPQIKELFIDTGLVSYTARDFPLSFHPNAQSAAEAAECAGEQNMYYQMHDQLFANGVEEGFNSYLPPANELGLDMDAFTLCLFSGAQEEEVKQDFADGIELGVNGTPAFFVNGELISGAQPFAVFKQKIEEKLN